MDKSIISLSSYEKITFKNDGLQIKSRRIKDFHKVLIMRGLTVKLVKIHVRKNRWKRGRRKV